MMRVACIIPTIGRELLARAINSVLPQMHRDDQLLVIGDGERPVARRIIEQSSPYDNLIYQEIPYVGDWGGSAIDAATKLATADMLCYLGDDDQMADGAIEAIRSAGETHPGKMHVFAIDFMGRRLQGSLEMTMVSGQQIVVPNDQPPSYAGNSRPENDHVFLLRAIERFGHPIMHDIVIAIVDRASRGQI